eukprot:TRINITY_DN20844_c1_g1_i1.p1 TRINITY_DN20844_c1_g1~~TRINITY_DN20844_c1_g1_i1.p1  ORF type:complete len:560 (+),score=85.06 TRINITY_DN20844_c1_g1_i1:52-1731(+)
MKLLSRLLHSHQKRCFRSSSFKVPNTNDMMALLYGHQMDVGFKWMKRGVDVCWLGEYEPLVKMYEMLDARLESEWVENNDGKGPRNWSEFVSYCSQKRVFDKLWIPNPLSQLGGGLNDIAFQEWINKYYPPANFNYLPFSVFLNLSVTFKAYSQGVRYKCLGNQFYTPCYPGEGIRIPPSHNVIGNLLRNAYLKDVMTTNFRKRFVLIPSAERSNGLVALTVYSVIAGVGGLHLLTTREGVIESVVAHARMRQAKLSAKMRRQKKLPTGELTNSFYPRKISLTYDRIIYLPPWMSAEDWEGSEQDAANLSNFFDITEFEKHWLPSSEIFGPRETLSDFFDASETLLNANGKIYLIWSNLSNIALKSNYHPIVEELEKNNRFLLRHFEDVPFSVAGKFARDQHQSAFVSELNQKMRVELWILEINRPMLPSPVSPVQKEEGGLMVAPEQENALVAASPSEQTEEEDAEPKTLQQYFYPQPDLHDYSDPSGRAVTPNHNLGDVFRTSDAGIARQKKLQAERGRSIRDKTRRRQSYMLLKSLGLTTKRKRMKASTGVHPRGS